MHDPDYFLALQLNTGWGRVLKRFAEWVDPEPGVRLLDIGCGPGLLPAIFSRVGVRAVGVDVELDMFRNGRIHSHVAAGDIHHPPFQAETFNVITMSNLLFLINDPAAILRQAFDLLNPGGELAMLNPSEQLSVSAAKELVLERNLTGLAKDSLINWAQRAEDNNRWTERDILMLLRENQFEFKETTVFMGPGFARVARGVKVDT